MLESTIDTSHYLNKSNLNFQLFLSEAINGEHRLLVANEPFQVQDFKKITDHLEEYVEYTHFNRRHQKISTCNGFDLETLGFLPIISKIPHNNDVKPRVCNILVVIMGRKIYRVRTYWMCRTYNEIASLCSSVTRFNTPFVSMFVVQTCDQTQLVEPAKSGDLVLCFLRKEQLD